MLFGYFASLGKPELRGEPKPVIAPLLGASNLRKLSINKITSENYIIPSETIYAQKPNRISTEILQNRKILNR